MAAERDVEREQAIRRWLAADTEAEARRLFGDVYRLCRLKLARTVVKLQKWRCGTVDEFVTDDVVQDVFIKLLNKGRDGIDPERIDGLLQRMADCTLIDVLRRRDRMHELNIEDTPERFLEVVDLQLDARALGLRIRLSQIMEALSAEHQNLWTLLAMGYSYAHIARILDVRLHTIKRRAPTLIKRVRAQIEDYLS